MFSQQTYPFIFKRVPIHSPSTYQAYDPCFLSSLLISKLLEGGAEDIVALQLESGTHGIHWKSPSFVKPFSGSSDPACVGFHRNETSVTWDPKEMVLGGAV